MRPFASSAACELDLHGRAQRLPPVLLLARPLQTDGAAGNLARDQGGVGGHVIGAVVAIAAGALRVDAAHPLKRQADEFGQGALEGEDALGVRPH